MDDDRWTALRAAWYRRASSGPVRQRKRLLSIVALHLVSLLLAPSAGGDSLDADALLRRADAAARRATDAEFTLEITVRHPDGAEVTRTIRAWQSGGDRRMVKILAPARLRGTGILVPEAGRIYVYLPAYGRVREVTGREGGDAFMGTDFSVRELALVRLAPSHAAALESAAAEEDVYVLRVTPTAPDEHDYATLRARIRRADDLISSLDYLDEKGAPYRTITMGDFRPAGEGTASYVVAHRIEVRDLRADRRTVALLKAASFDQGLDDAFFTERMLKRLP